MNGWGHQGAMKPDPVLRKIYWTEQYFNFLVFSYMVCVIVGTIGGPILG